MYLGVWLHDAFISFYVNIDRMACMHPFQKKSSRFINDGLLTCFTYTYWSRKRKNWTKLIGLPSKRDNNRTSSKGRVQFINRTSTNQCSQFNSEAHDQNSPFWTQDSTATQNPCQIRPDPRPSISRNHQRTAHLYAATNHHLVKPLRTCCIPHDQNTDHDQHSSPAS